jgi:hypothetical protein
MSTFGDLLEKMGRNSGLSPQELELLRLKGNNMDNAMMTVNAWTGPGVTNPHFENFYAEQGEFGTLPHAVSSMARDSDQVIQHNTKTVVTYEVKGDLVANMQKFSFAEGILDDPGQGTFQVHLTAGSLVLFCGFVAWEANATGLREVRLRSGSGGNTPISSGPAVDGGSTVQAFAVIRQMVTEDDRHFLRVYQNSGGELNLVTATFAAARIR